MLDRWALSFRLSGINQVFDRSPGIRYHATITQEHEEAGEQYSERSVGMHRRWGYERLLIGNQQEPSIGGEAPSSGGLGAPDLQASSAFSGFLPLAML